MWVYMTIITFPSTGNSLLLNFNTHTFIWIHFAFLLCRNNRKSISFTVLCLSGVWMLFCFPTIPPGFVLWIWPHSCLCLSLGRVLIGSPLTGQPARRTGDVYKCPVGHGSSSSCIKLDLSGENWLYSGFFPVCVFVPWSFFEQSIKSGAPNSTILHLVYGEKQHIISCCFCLWKCFSTKVCTPSVFGHLYFTVYLASNHKEIECG